MLFLAFLAAPRGCSAFSPSTQGLIKSGTTQRFKMSSKTAPAMGLFGQEKKTDDGPTTIMTIPVSNIKPKPLRFFLQIYIVGDKNSQDNQSWLPRESEDGGRLLIYYKDGTGMCQIELENHNIQIVRHGQSPSLEYMLQESVMLHGVLDELYKMALGGEHEDLKDNERLLLLEDESVLDKCRETLPARKA